MKTLNIFIISLSVVSLAIGGCSKSENQIVNPPSDSNLLTNGSFEIGGAGSLQGWSANTSDTAFVNFSTDVPPGGGSFSVRLRNEWSFPGTLWQTIVSTAGTHRYRLSAFGKAIRSNINAGGDMRIQFKQSGGWISTKSFHFSDTTWTSASLLDTLTTASGDTIAVNLRGNIDQFSFGYVLFDLVKLEKLD